MDVLISNNIRVDNPTPELSKWVQSNLVIRNPEYAKKMKLGFSTRGVPEKLYLYEIDGSTLVLPFGVLRNIFDLIGQGAIHTDFPTAPYVEYRGQIPLYDYQEEAVTNSAEYLYGILQSPPGSGKTQMGLALIQRLGRRALWLTHTQDLLIQSRRRAEQYFPASLMGEISAGKVRIGQGITFATVQTMAKLDLPRYKHIWDVIIVDECHRVSGSPTSVSLFYKVLNNLAARHKYGLSATVHRSDGMIKATYAMLGEIMYSVPEEAVADRVLKVNVNVIYTGEHMGKEGFNSDGTLNYGKYITALVNNQSRNQQIVNQLSADKGMSCLILSDRIEHLTALREMLPPDMAKTAAQIDGSMTSKANRELREQYIEDMRNGKKKILFATYVLAKEGLDIPRLERLYLTTPHTDYAVIAQSIGRIARTFPGKECPIAYDFVDYDPHSAKFFNKRKTTYRKCGCEINA